MKASPGRRVRAYAYTLVTTAIVLLFALSEWLAERFASEHSRIASSAIEGGIVLIAALLFRPIHRRVDEAIDSAFYRRKRQALAALARFRRELTSYTDRAQLLRRTIEAVERHLEAQGCAVYLRRETFCAEVSSFDVPAQNVGLDDPLAVRLRSSGMPARPPELKSIAVGTHAFAMMVAGDLIGFLAVDRTGGDFDPDEAQMLAGLAEELALALLALDPSLRPAKAKRHNIPSDLPPLIGREQELDDILAALQHSRLVTLTGAGGVGKTHVALHAATQVQANDGAWFVDLAPITDPALVAGAIGSVFGVADEGAARPPVERVAAALREKDALVVLDNCEHLVAAAAQAAAYLLQSCPRISILATSREPLGLETEQPYRLPSLPVPPADAPCTAMDALRYDAVALFVARARAADHTFALTDRNAPVVAEIVRRIDGIAMAIELAASRVRIMSLQQIDAHLNERFRLLTGGARTALPRHQTLHALIGWSYELLDDRERAMLRSVSVFRGDWTLDAAQTVYAQADDFETIDLLQALVDKSLMSVRSRGEERRYRLLESTRQFAAQQLDGSEERDACRERQCSYFASLAQRYGERYWRTDSDEWTALVRGDLENIRAALAWGFSPAGDACAAAAIVADLRWFWYAAARREGRELLERAAPAAQRGDARTRGLVALAAAVLDASAQAAPAANEAVSLLRDLDRTAFAEALAFGAIALGRGGRVDASREHFSAAIAAARTTDAPRLVGWVLSMAAYWRGAAGDADEATRLFGEAAEVLRFCGDPWQLARLQLHRAEFHFAQSEHALAMACVREAESVFRSRRYDTGRCITLLNGCAYLLAMEQLEDAWTRAREGLEIACRLDNEMAMAWAIGHLAEIAAHGGHARVAARLLGRADAIYAKTGSAREPTEQRGYDRALQMLRAEFSTIELDALMNEGANVHRDILVHEAMAIPQPQTAVASTA